MSLSWQKCDNEQFWNRESSFSTTISNQNCRDHTLQSIARTHALVVATHARATAKTKCICKSQTTWKKKRQNANKSMIQRRAHFGQTQRDGENEREGETATRISLENVTGQPIEESKCRTPSTRTSTTTVTYIYTTHMCVPTTALNVCHGRFVATVVATVVTCVCVHVCATATPFLQHRLEKRVGILIMQVRARQHVCHTNVKWCGLFSMHGVGRHRCLRHLKMCVCAQQFCGRRAVLHNKLFAFQLRLRFTCTSGTRMGTHLGTHLGTHGNLPCKTHRPAVSSIRITAKQYVTTPEMK